MKSKILILSAAAIVLFSCGTQKTAIAEASPKAAETTKGDVDLTPELLEGKNLYENSCAKCHKLYEPKKFDKEKWAPILVRMQKKAKLDDVKMASITNYIHSQL
ncbi:cytochrome c [Flavobacterium foetidum]|uniref:cytochrome c n=1 Tax=Flavobacterium foetidum TaxID=2026681 RepID=UPI0010751DF7|nr:cytochrome c [Flavobacterium foetidum]KAF2516551.1 cytochrome c [Flavobacterium foetidum]